jgi:predicted nucleic acid-binding protein
LTLVIDASVAVKAALAEQWATRWRREPLAAPTLLWSEAASALRQLVVRGEISAAEAANALSWLVSAAITPHPSPGLVSEAIALAEELGWAKTYDAEYVVLARRLDAMLVTGDARLQRGASRVATVVGPQEAGAEPTAPLFESGLPALATSVDENLKGFGER